MADYKPIQEGDSLDASKLDERFTTLEEAANNVSAVSRRTFDHYHGTHSLVEPNIAFDTGARFMGHAGNGSAENDVAIDLYGAHRHHYTYGGSGNAVWPGVASSDLASGATGVGWRVIGDTLPTYGYGDDTIQGRSDAKLECTFGAGVGVQLAEAGHKGALDQIGGVLVLFNAEALFFHDEAKTPQCVGRTVSGIGIKFRARFVLQVKVRKHDGADLGWLNLKKSHRALSMPSSGMNSDTSSKIFGVEFKSAGLATSHHRPVRGAMWKDISIRTLITHDDLNIDGLDYPLDPGPLKLQGVRAVVSLEIPGTIPTITGTDLYDDCPEGAGIALKAYSMTTLALSSEYKV